MILEDYHHDYDLDLELGPSFCNLNLQNCVCISMVHLHLQIRHCRKVVARESESQRLFIHQRIVVAD